MSNDLDALLQEAPTLTFEPFPEKKEEPTSLEVEVETTNKEKSKK